MKPYTFFKHDGRSAPSFDLGEFENDREARAWALRMLARNPRYSAVEVWDGIHDPFTVERQDYSSSMRETETRYA